MNQPTIFVHKNSESAEIGNTLEDLAAWAAIGFLPRSQTVTKDGKPLRTDGPTLAEYVAAGFPAGNYPPEDYTVNPGAPAPVADSKPAVVPVADSVPKGDTPSLESKQPEAAGVAPVADSKPAGNAKSKG